MYCPHYSQNSELLTLRGNMRANYVMVCVLVRVSIPGQNIMTKKQVGEERVYSAYISTLLFITERSQDWTQADQEARANAEAMEGCSLLASSGLLSLLSYRTQGIQPRDGTTHKGPFPLDH